MKLNQKLYNTISQEPVTVSYYDNDVKCEIYYLNDCSSYIECIKQSRFSVWTTLDGKTFRILVEKGYYECVPELYDDKTNKIWIDFWNDLDKIKKSFMLKVMTPILVVYYVLLFVIAILCDKQNEGSSMTVIMIGAILGFILLYFLANKVLSKKIRIRNHEAIQHIKKIKGAKKFDLLLKAQRNYAEDFFNEKEDNENEIQNEKEENNETEVQNKKETGDDESDTLESEQNEEIK